MLTCIIHKPRRQATLVVRGLQSIFDWSLLVKKIFLQGYKFVAVKLTTKMQKYPRMKISHYAIWFLFVHWCRMIFITCFIVQPHWVLVLPVFNFMAIFCTGCDSNTHALDSFVEFNFVPLFYLINILCIIHNASWRGIYPGLLTQLQKKIKKKKKIQIK